MLLVTRARAQQLRRITGILTAVFLVYYMLSVIMQVVPWPRHSGKFLLATAVIVVVLGQWYALWAIGKWKKADTEILRLEADSLQE